MSQIENGKQIERLFRNWPQAKLTDENVQTYGEAIANQHRDDVRLACDDFIFGRVTGRNHDFIPQPGTLSAQIHKRRNERIDYEARMKPRATALPAPSKPASQEQRKELTARLMKPYREAFQANRPASTPEKLEAQKQALQREELFAAIMVGDDAALAKLNAENASIPLSISSRKYLGLPIIGNEPQEAVA